MEKKELEKILQNLILSNHAKKRIKERLDITNIDEIKNLITQPYFIWRNTDNTINIAIDEFRYFVIKKTKDNFYIIITFKEESTNKINVKVKFSMALKGKQKKQQ